MNGSPPVRSRSWKMPCWPPAFPVTCRAATNCTTIGVTSGSERMPCGTGSTALSLAYVAAGRFDGYYAFDNHAWDVAAGAVLVREAGGMVTHVQPVAPSIRLCPMVWPVMGRSIPCSWIACAKSPVSCALLEHDGSGRPKELPSLIKGFQRRCRIARLTSFTKVRPAGAVSSREG